MPVRREFSLKSRLKFIDNLIQIGDQMWEAVSRFRFHLLNHSTLAALDEGYYGGYVFAFEGADLF